MRYLKTYEEKKKKEHPYSLHGRVKGVKFKGLTQEEKNNEIEKLKIIQEYFDVDAVSGSIEKIESNFRSPHYVYDLDFGHSEDGGMSITFNISGDYFDSKWYGRIVLGYDKENDQFVGDGEGEEYEFPFDYYNIENLKDSIEQVIKWSRDPESYEAYKNAIKYNL